MMTGRNHHPRTHNRNRMRDFAFYVAIAVAVGITAIVVAQTSLGHETFIKWGGLIINTLVLFGYFIADSRSLWRCLSFWLLVCALLSIHLAVFSALLVHIVQWKLIWFMVMYLEIPVFVLCRKRFLSGIPN